MKKLLSIFMSLVISFCVISYFNSKSVNAVDGNENKLIGKASVTNNETSITHLLEKYEDGTIIVKSQYVGESQWNVKSKLISSFEFSINSYEISYENEKGTINSVESISNSYNLFNYYYTYSYDDTNAGLIITFTLKPTEYCDGYFKIDGSSIDGFTSIKDKDDILNFDINDDGLLDAVDSTMILNIYAINSTGGNIKTLTDYKNYLNENENVIENTTTETSIEDTTEGLLQDSGDLTSELNSGVF